jgi:four helix bundle protein
MSPSRAPARTSQDLVVWQKAHQFVLAVYSYSSGFPKTETYGLVTQLRRAAVSIAANIAEGFRRVGRADNARMLNIAEGSLEECRYYLILPRDLNYGPTQDLLVQLDEVGRIRAAYTKAILSPVS